MIQRISGGNSGIASYLRTGIKQGRDYSRAEMDRRYTLQGDLDLTDKIINSIHDKGQERYLHITLSFYENDISVEKVNEVVKEYKELLMSAYDESEYNFYAELHHPILKNYTDNSTGALVERKPHVHIVIPEKNLITGKHLNPRGRGEFNIEQLDSIQEHINKKYDLKSPKDCIRVSDQNHANVLARSKGDLFKELEGEFKLNLIKSLDEKNIKTVEDFKKHLETFGEVRTYNAGKKNEYLGVNLGKSGKFTRLKSPLFSKEYITNRSIPLLKKSEDRIKKDLDNWKNINSLEIKLINTASQKIRQSYAKLSYEDKLVALKKIEEQYNEKHGITKLSTDVRRTNTVRSIEIDSRGNARATTNNWEKIGLPRMPASGMVYGLERGARHRASDKPTSILPSVQSGNMAKVRRAIDTNSPVRRTQSNQGKRRIGDTDNLIDTSITKASTPSSEESKQMRAIRDSLNPDRFLSYCQKRFNIDPKEHKVTLKNGGSPRFAVGSRNLNASDFLTKHIGLDWKDAKNALLELQKNQQEQTYYVPVLDRQPLTREEAKERFESLTSSIKKLNTEQKEAFKELNASFRNDLKNCYTIKNKGEREAQKTLAKFFFERDKENLNQKYSNLKTEVKQTHNNWISKAHALDILNSIKDNKMENTISSGQEQEQKQSISEKMKKHHQFEEFRTEYNKKLTDLIASKKGSEVHYINKDTKKPAFIDRGEDLNCKSKDKEDLGIMLEYAEKKFGGKLKLSGMPEFKEKIAQVVAEKGLNIILTPEKYHNMMLEHAQKIKESSVDNTIEKAEQQPQHEVQENTDLTTDKEKQLDIILKNNPMNDDIHTGIRSVKDIKTFKEAVASDEVVYTPDYTETMAKNALESGKITVYSSKPIEQGVFVTPSKMEAESYAGGKGKPVYSKEIDLKEVAWIDTIEGQYAKIDQEQKPQISDEQLNVDTKQEHSIDYSVQDKIVPTVSYYINDNDFIKSGIDPNQYSTTLNQHLENDTMFASAQININHGENETDLNINGFENNNIAYDTFNTISNQALEELHKMNEMNKDIPEPDWDDYNR